jgi:hypothetical protein
VPSGILSPKEMQAVMWDMLRADQFLTSFVFNKDSTLNKTTESIKYYQQVFSIHQISEEEFQKSFSYYKAHPSLFKIIMDSLSKTTTDAPTQRMDTGYLKDTNQAKFAQPHPADTFFRLKKKKGFSLN